MHLYLFLTLLLLSKPAHAYIDASIGSMLIQGLVAVLMLIPFYVRKILNFFKKKHDESNDDEQN